MMRKPTLAERWQYAFDNYMARGTAALIAGLGLASLAIVVVMGLIVVLLGVRPAGADQSLSFPEAVWLSLMRTLDAGTMGGDEGWGFRLAMLVVTIGGVFVISTLIGVLTSGIESRLDQLRKGRSRVLETGHTVILGWTSSVFTIISELAIANANQRSSCVVILGEIDKVAMEEQIRDHVGTTGRMRVVCRTGSPIDLNDLAMVSLDSAKSIIVLAPEGPEADAAVIKTLVAITNNPQRRPEPFHIVAELREQRNAGIARIASRGEAELVLVEDIIARIAAQTCRQSGLSAVFDELLDFEGAEIYFQAEPRLVGQKFGDALLAYEDSAVIGLALADGATLLNPPMDTVLPAEARIIAISEDDDTVRLSGRNDYGIDESAIAGAAPAVSAAERTLVLGWNPAADLLIRELDQYVADGSELVILAEHPLLDAEVERLGAGLAHLQLRLKRGDTTDRAVLDELAIHSFDHIILLCYSDLLEPEQADARALTTLLHLRDIADRTGFSGSIVSEMLVQRNRQLAESARADDFIVSGHLISLLLTCISENKQLAPVFAGIFDADGSEVYLKPAANYVALDRALNFYTVVEAARRRGEVAFGYRIASESHDPQHSYGVYVNPRKSQPVEFSAEDKIIVLAEN
jgi:ion channel POLLUX/CASTOR